MPDRNLRHIHVDDAGIIELQSSNDTESDIPGHGRTLGNMYSRAGRVLDAFLKRRTKKEGRRPPLVVAGPPDPHPQTDLPDWRRYYPDDVHILEIDSADATDSDLPGHGRVLGNFYSYTGRRLMQIVNGLAGKSGLGPSAIAMRIKNRVHWGRGRGYNLKIIYTEKEEDEQKKDLKRLIHYAKSVHCLHDGLDRC